MIQMLKKIPHKYLLLIIVVQRLFDISGGFDVFGQTGGTIGSVNWELDGFGSLTFSGTGDLHEKFTEYSVFDGLLDDVEQIYVGLNISSIGSNAFSRCPKVKIVYIGTDVTDIHYDAFRNNTTLLYISVVPDNPSYYDYSGMLIQKSNNMLAICPQAQKGICLVPEMVEVIGSYAFRDCIGLNSVILPSELKRIDHYAFYNCGVHTLTLTGSEIHLGFDAFYGCKNLVSFHLPKILSTIGNPFGNCESLESIIVDDNDSGFKSIDGVVFSKDGKLLLFYPSGRKGEYTIPEGVTYIGSSSFYTCNNLTRIILSPTVETISGNAFSFCNSLKSLAISPSVTKIDYNVLDQCPNVSEIICFSPVPPKLVSGSFSSDLLNNGVLRVPAALMDSYIGAEEWMKFQNIEPLQDEIEMDYAEKYVMNGGTMSLKAAITGGAANPNVVLLSSSNPEVATIDSKGKLTAINPGTTVITASIDEEEVECRVTVIAKGKLFIENAGEQVERVKLYENECCD